MPSKLEFLTSTRFWSLVLIAVVGVLGKEGIISADIVNALQVLLWGYVGVRTADKFSGALSK
jgi:hypothetical protein